MKFLDFLGKTLSNVREAKKIKTDVKICKTFKMLGVYSLLLHTHSLTEIQLCRNVYVQGIPVC